MEVVSILSDAEIAGYLSRNGRRARPRPPYNLLFPTSLVKRAARHLRVNGDLECEQLVLWSGYPTEQGVVLAALLLPETEATWGWVHVLPKEQPAIVSWLQEKGQLLFVEAHTHGYGPGATEISEEDRRHPAGRQDGFLTIIVPYYARDGMDFSRVGIWECASLEWTRMRPGDVRVRVHIVSDEEARHVLA